MSSGVLGEQTTLPTTTTIYSHLLRQLRESTRGAESHLHVGLPESHLHVGLPGHMRAASAACATCSSENNFTDLAYVAAWDRPFLLFTCRHCID